MQNSNKGIESGIKSRLRKTETRSVNENYASRSRKKKYTTSKWVCMRNSLPREVGLRYNNVGGAFNGFLNLFFSFQFIFPKEYPFKIFFALLRLSFVCFTCLFALHSIIFLWVGIVSACLLRGVIGFLLAYSGACGLFYC